MFIIIIYYYYYVYYAKSKLLPANVAERFKTSMCAV